MKITKFRRRTARFATRQDGELEIANEISRALLGNYCPAPTTCAHSDAFTPITGSHAIRPLYL
jgi:hypothetical protein